MTTPYAIAPSRLAAIIDFLQAAEKLKDTLRSGITSNGRAESTAEHSWRLCLMVMLFDRELADYDRLKLLRLCLVHDLGEAISGDVPATCQSPDDGRAARERADLETLCAPLPDDLRGEILSLWDEYSGGTTPEARMVKGFDKLETMLQHLIGRNAADFDYAFNLTYGTQHTVRHPLLFQIRELVDAATRERIAACGTRK
ncbi:phosphohydrolase [Sphingopyxis sp. H038]|uniref:HD domain-containing protein n=1 Tax=unclassified Sphingopyxis TaxID=2614943 RepID=UPI000730C809|nr:MULTISPECIES: HD domain-containing protein [unclassified Sphingopyxis]KTE00388.1 phosphohydrolase [Sphingopyxis sp. H012]KTE06621.1 phosphohydrolase [Sphingopyxis sp. H053]KTE08880.1 phosphohydrolase [Sphingopyxis sp. H093]KTE18959.1 phosphohydrolase [Sphingopyxis sp. H080]KTE32665.1 phosphohydrolase [Sphingopyxis sp. H038]